LQYQTPTNGDGWVEGDAKLCLDAINGDGSNVTWKICTLVSNIKLLALSFNYCSFSWVCRDANNVAHSLAKFAASQPTSLY
jgi:hypothetical protein